MSRRLLLVVLIAAALAGCQRGGNKTEPPALAASQPASGQALLIAPEDLRTVGGADAQAQGPVITGSIEPERRADLRAEVAAVVVQVLRENGDAVHKGDLLVRLDDTAIRDSLGSAQESERASAQAFEQAERQAQRLKTLQAQGMSSMQAMEDAEVRRNNAQSDLAATRAKVVAARQQLQRTEVRAPFDGIVSDRKVSAGDTTQIGKELLKVIDPASMRFEGLVAAEHMPLIQVGQAVSFRVSGYPQGTFGGQVKRVAAAANDTTRQVEVLVSFTEGTPPRTAGLYAEGRILAGGPQALMLPESSIVRAAGAAYVWRVKDKTLSKVPVQLGARDERRGEYLVREGLARGDQVLRNPGSALVDGQKVEFAGAASSSAGS